MSRELAGDSAEDFAPDQCDGDHNFKDGVCQRGNCGFSQFGTPVFEFDEGKHIYTLDGKPLTGVTSVLGVLAKPALIPWAAKMTVEYLKANAPKDGKKYIVEPLLLEAAKGAHNQNKVDAGKHGTAAHALVEEYINECLGEGHNGLPQAVSPHNEKYATIKPFIEWAYEEVDHFLFSERRMYNVEKWLAGTADFAYVGKDGKRYIADFKTSSGIYGIDYWLQAAAYRFLAEAEGDEPYEGATIVRLGKDGRFEVQQAREYGLFLDTFFACLTIYRAQAKVAMFVTK